MSYAFVNPSSKIDFEEIEMSKTKEELNALKEEVETVNEKLAELTPEELEKVNGGVALTSRLIVAHGFIPLDADDK